jgi:hypothetical protein
MQISHDLETKDAYDKAPIHVAKSSDVIDVLVRHGANRNSKSSSYHFSILIQFFQMVTMFYI